MKLSPRLEVLAKCVKPGAKIADIGTDHAKIPIYLILNNVIEYAVASDVNEGPLKKAETNLEKYKLKDKIRLCLANGAEGTRDFEADTLIVAGMGGELICEIILTHIPKGVETLILQPMTNTQELRRKLLQNGFSIDEEKLVAEKAKIYNILIVSKGKNDDWSDKDFILSPKLKADPLYKTYLNKELAKVNKALSGLTDKNEKHQEFTKLKSWIEEDLIN